MNLKLTTCLVTILLFVSCTNNLDVDVVKTTSTAESDISVLSETENPFVSEAQALFVAKKFQNLPQTRNQEDERADVQTIFDENNTPLMYIINYPDQKFIIIGATRNYYPILAYSDKNNLSINQESGLLEWLKETKYAIKESESYDEDLTSRMRFLWNFYEKPQVKEVAQTRGSAEENRVMRARMSELMQLYPGYYCRPLSQCSSSDFPLYGTDIYEKLCRLASQFNTPLEYTICAIKDNSHFDGVDPLTQTEWHQGYPFNAPYNNNPIGCVTVAIAQIMKFHQFPNQYNWNSMPPSNYQATSETHRLISDILSATGIDPNQDSEATIDDAQNAFNSFQYSVSKKNHNNGDVENELRLKRHPVYMRGSDKNSGKGHAWVCDGVRTYKSEVSYFIECREGGPGNYYYRSIDGPSPESPATIEYTGGTDFHMNWGWGGTGSGNGWFRTNDVSVGDYDLSIARKNLYVSPK